MADDYHFDRSYLDNGRPGDDLSKPSNWVISSSDIPQLICPDDTTALTAIGKANLSYAVNGGFSRWHAAGHAYGWAGPARTITSTVNSSCPTTPTTSALGVRANAHRNTAPRVSRVRASTRIRSSTAASSGNPDDWSLPVYAHASGLDNLFSFNRGEAPRGDR